MIRHKLPKKKILTYTIFMSVMFFSAGIIFYRTYAPHRSAVPPLTNSAYTSLGTGQNTSTQPVISQSDQKQDSLPNEQRELFENPKFADRVSVPGFEPVNQQGVDIVDTTQTLPVQEVKVFNIGTGTDVLITWKDPNDSRVKECAVYRSEDAAQLGTVIASVAKGKQTYRDREVLLGKTYFYTIGSRGDEIQEGLSVQTTVTVTDTIPPSAPREVRVSQTSQASVHISWSSSEDESVVLYRMYRSQAEGVLGDEIATVPVTSPLVYDDALVTPGNSYYYAVVSVDSGGNSSAPQQTKPNIGNPYPFGR